MPIMSPTKPTLIRIPEGMKAEFQAYCDSQGMEFAAGVRLAMCKLMERMDLLEQMPAPGRPMVEQPKRPRRPKAED